MTKTKYIPKCPVCQTRRWAKRIRNDYFRCTSCGSIWESKGFTLQERLARFCPICEEYVEYDNWHPYDNWYPWDKGKLRNFHYKCHTKHEIEVEKFRKEFEKEVKRAELISQIECPNCKDGQICQLPDGWYDIIYMCDQCEAIYSEEWINKKIKEKENEHAFLDTA